jgi:hypothetical protein
MQYAQLPRTRIPALNQKCLIWLCVARTEFSNPAIEDLPDSLVYFDATRTRIDDQGLKDFLRLRNLRKLVLLRTPTTEAGIDRLKATMPWCDVAWEPLQRR